MIFDLFIGKALPVVAQKTFVEHNAMGFRQAEVTVTDQIFTVNGDLVHQLFVPIALLQIDRRKIGKVYNQIIGDKFRNAAVYMRQRQLQIIGSGADIGLNGFGITFPVTRIAHHQSHSEVLLDFLRTLIGRVGDAVIQCFFRNEKIVIQTAADLCKGKFAIVVFDVNIRRMVPGGFFRDIGSGLRGCSG